MGVAKQWPIRVSTNAVYDVPVIRQRSFRAVSFREQPRRAIHSVGLPGGLNLQFYVNLKSARVLRVVFHGWLDQNTNALPRFDRVGSSLSSDDAYLAFADPTLQVSKDLGIAWFLGTSQCDPTRAIIEIVERVRREVGAESVLFVGGSGGGHAALRFGALVPHSAAFVFNPQTDISRYHSRLVRDYLKFALKMSPPNIEDFAKSNILRESMTHLYGEYYPLNKVFFFQNKNDKFHLENHYAPFCEAVERGIRGGRLFDGQFKSVLVDSGNGHCPPTPEEFATAMHQAREFFGFDV